MRNLLIAAAAALSIASSNAQAQVPLSAYVDANGFINVQAMMCAQLAGTYQEDADMLTTWYSGWYNGLAKKHYIHFSRAKQDEHEIIMTCKANPQIRIIDAIARVLKDERARLGIQLKTDSAPSRTGENARVGRQAVSTVFAFTLATCAIGVGAAAAQQSAPNNLFTAAGFVVQHADTPEKHSIMRRLPPDKLVTRKRGGKTYYLYADPTICRCVYVGTPRAYQAFQTGSDGSQFLKGGESRGVQMLDEFAEQDTAQAGATSFDDYVFGGMQDD